MQLEKLAALSDEELDYSDIPATKDFTGFVRAGNKSLNEVISQSIEQQALKVDWNEINQVLDEIQKANQKSRVSLRLDGDVADYYRSTGKKYQTRINDILRAVMILEQKAHSHQ